MKTIIQYILERLKLNDESKISSSHVFDLYNKTKNDYHWMDYPHTTNYKKVVYNNVSIFFPNWHGYTYTKLICDIFEKIIDNNKDILKDCSFIYAGLLDDDEWKEDELKFILYSALWDKKFDLTSLTNAKITHIKIFVKDYTSDKLLNGWGVGCYTLFNHLRGKIRKIAIAFDHYIGSKSENFDKDR